MSSRAIVGRDAALQALGRMLDAVLEGAPQLALIAGEPGVGKTRLVGALEARGRELGFLVLHGESLEFGGEEFPYAPVVAALRRCRSGRSSTTSTTTPAARSPCCFPASKAAGRASRIGSGRAGCTS